MKLVYNDPKEVKRKVAESILFMQEGGMAPTAPAEGMEAPQDTQAMDIQTMMNNFSQSQDPNVAVQILQTISNDPSTAVNVVNLLVQQMNSASPETQPEQMPTEEVPEAKYGMKLDAMSLEDFYSSMNEQKKSKKSKGGKNEKMKSGGKTSYGKKVKKKK